MADDRRLVYSTAAPGKGLKKSGRKKTLTKAAGPVLPLPPTQQTVRIRRESKGRGGKTVTLVTGIQASPDQLRVILKEIKARVGGGGAVKDGELVIQGDHRQIVLGTLEKKGFRPKLAGG
ncbi:MAG: translation initiation factor [Mariprofundaceae bacterium]